VNLDEILVRLEAGDCLNKYEGSKLLRLVRMAADAPCAHGFWRIPDGRYCIERFLVELESPDYFEANACVSCRIRQELAND